MSDGHWARLNLAMSSELTLKPPDLWLISSEGFFLPTNASLLTLHSHLLKTLLSHSSFNSSSSSLSIPIPALPLSLLLALLAQGSVNHHLPFNPLEVLEAAELLGIDIDLHVADETEQSPLIGSEESRVSFSTEENSVVEDFKTDAKLEVMQMEEDGIFQCKACEYRTTRKGNMTNHTRVHSSNSYLYKCPKNGCVFKAKSKSHMHSHNDAKHKGVRFDCNLCDYQTAYRKDLGRHVQGKHKGGTPFAWPCDKCNFKGMNIRELKFHIKTRHKEATMD